MELLKYNLTRINIPLYNASKNIHLITKAKMDINKTNNRIATMQEASDRLDRYQVAEEIFTLYKYYPVSGWGSNMIYNADIPIFEQSEEPKTLLDHIRDEWGTAYGL